MKKKNVRIISFRATQPMCAAIERVMDSRGIDQTSVIKLSLYALDVYLNRSATTEKDLFDIVRELEDEAAPHLPSFALFSLASSPQEE